MELSRVAVKTSGTGLTAGTLRLGGEKLKKDFKGIPNMQRLWVSAGVVFPVVSTAVWFWILDVVGIEHWVAQQIGEFIGVVITSAE